MTQYRKKPVVIEAFQLTQKIHDDIWLSEEGSEEIPDWFADTVFNSTLSLRDGKTTIRTLEGDMTANIGDWIIKGVKGEIYPCKPDIFEATYDVV